MDWNVTSSLLSLGLAIHKTPVVYKECAQVYTDVSKFWQTFGRNFSLPFFIADVGLNTFINFIDIYNVGLKGVTSLQQGDYSDFGISAGTIASDMFLKNPLSSDWTFNNSAVFQEQLSQGLPPQDYIPQQMSQIKLESGMKEWRLKDELGELEASLRRAKER